MQGWGGVGCELSEFCRASSWRSSWAIRCWSEVDWTAEAPCVGKAPAAVGGWVAGGWTLTVGCGVSVSACVCALARVCGAGLGRREGYGECLGDPAAAPGRVREREELESLLASCALAETLGGRLDPRGAKSNVTQRHELKHHKLLASNAASMAFRRSSGVCFLFGLRTSGFVGRSIVNDNIYNIV